MTKKWSTEDIAWKAENEGLEYMITDYLSADSIEDEELKSLWKQVNEAIDRIKEILRPYNSNEE